MDGVRIGEPGAPAALLGKWMRELPEHKQPEQRPGIYRESVKQSLKNRISWSTGLLSVLGLMHN